MKEVEQESKREREAGTPPLGNQTAGWGEPAFPLNTDLFFLAWGWGPENSPAILDSSLLGPLESWEGY